MKNRKLVLFSTVLMAGIIALAGCATTSSTGVTSVSAPTASQVVNTGIGAITYTADATTLMSTYLQFAPAYEQAQQSIQTNMKYFTPTNQKTLTQISANLTALQNKVIDALTRTGSTGSILLNFGQMQLIYAEAKGDYLNAKAIITPVYSKLPAGTQLQLKTLNSLATQLNDQMTVLDSANVNGYNVTSLLEGMLTLAGTAAQLANTGAMLTALHAAPAA